MADDPAIPAALRDELRGSWHRFLDLLAPLRPSLHGYCRKLTGNVGDAEDDAIVCERLYFDAATILRQLTG
jgi:hypothetical protein